jgi:predicted helicase
MLVIIGNPPYRVASLNNGEFILNLINDYKFVDGKSLGEKKHSLNDDYVKFIRFAQHKIDQVDEGIVGLVTNHGFIDNPTFRGMRASLLKTFNQIYIIDLHGNAKKKETSPDGSVDENVFDIQQGVCITFFIKREGLNRGVYLTDFWGKRESKFKQCFESSFKTTDWQKLTPITPNYYFINFDNKGAEFYEKFWGIKDIFVESVSGIVTSRDKLTIDINKNILYERIEDFSSLPVEQAREKYHLGEDGRDWKVHFAQKNLNENGLSINHIKPIHYRPFDVRSIYYTKQSKGILSNPRYGLMLHMLAGDNAGLMVTRQSSAPNWQHVFIGNKISDMCYISNKTSENGYYCPLYLYPAERDSSKSSLFPDHSERHQTRIENFTPDFRAFIDTLYNHHYSPEEILGYMYAILHSPQYRTQYLEFLKKDYPRIPFVKSRKTFDRLSKMGWGLVQTHLMKTIPKLGLGAYIGKGNHVVEKISYAPNEKKIIINPTQHFEQVPQNVWDFCIGGYQVLDKYLKSRKGRTLSFDEIQNIENVVNILAFTINQINEIDQLYKSIQYKDFV